MAIVCSRTTSTRPQSEHLNGQLRMRSCKRAAQHKGKRFALRFSKQINPGSSRGSRKQRLQDRPALAVTNRNLYNPYQECRY